MEQRICTYGNDSPKFSCICRLAAATEIDAKTGMPMRTLGSTGQKVSLLAFGAGSRWLAYKDRDKALEALERALKAGRELRRHARPPTATGRASSGSANS